MKVIIAGSRDITDRAVVFQAIEASGFEITEVICGGCRGVDTLGAEWAKQKGIPVTVVHADWPLLGRAAGPIRNAKMAEMGEALILVWDGKSAGSRNMLNLARAKWVMISETVVS